ncbi:ArnT family glycosyltransferase [Robiginitomaculum antarcticum]|uniref:ArnT family glycosyltransferase n=1 Tax=Robiginitomaculum antarcticum TaxID=437507 RepID=UPI0003A8DE5B|nr:glycosyltransferase family 39 protein [Robiginitomaculum antarcticum]
MFSAPPHSRLRHILILTGLVLLTALPGLFRIPAIDRDEARYAQATVQMLETGDPVDIRFQDAPRWKKPAGAYWAQAVSVTIFGGPESRQIWKHRVPSVLAALLAVLATYWAGRRLVGRDAAVIGAALLAVTLSLTYEAHAAKTDALMVAMTTVCFGALAHIRHNPLATQKTAALLFWIALGIGVMMKGPIAPLLVGLTIATLMIWERKAKWAKPLLFWPGPILFLLVILPWTVLIWHKTGGAFFATAIGEDLAPKLTGGQENHGGLPGYHLVALLVMFMPAIALLPAGVEYAVRALRGDSAPDSPVKRAMRLIICWVVPFWIVIEITPTKLPHYALPTYPALALLCGTAGALLLQIREFDISRYVGAALFGVIGTALTGGVVYAHYIYGDDVGLNIWAVSLGVIVACIIIMAAAMMITRHRYFIAAIIGSGAVMMVFTFGYIMPALSNLFVSKNVAAIMASRNIDLPLDKSAAFRSPHFTEASLVYKLGTHIKLGGDFNQSSLGDIQMGEYLLIDEIRRPALDIDGPGRCFKTLGYVRGHNYAKSDDVILRLLQRVGCPAN